MKAFVLFVLLSLIGISVVSQQANTAPPNIVPVGGIIPWWGSINKNDIPKNYELWDGTPVVARGATLKGGVKPSLIGGSNKASELAKSEADISTNQIPAQMHSTSSKGREAVADNGSRANHSSVIEQGYDNPSTFESVHFIIRVR